MREFGAELPLSMLEGFEFIQVECGRSGV